MVIYINNTTHNNQYTEQSNKTHKNLIKPIIDIFNNKDANTIEQSVGQSTCTSGSQNIKGNIGILDSSNNKKVTHMT